MSFDAKELNDVGVIINRDFLISLLDRERTGCAETKDVLKEQLNEYKTKEKRAENLKKIKTIVAASLLAVSFISILSMVFTEDPKARQFEALLFFGGIALAFTFATWETSKPLSITSVVLGAFFIFLLATKKIGPDEIWTLFKNIAKKEDVDLKANKTIPASTGNQSQFNR